jgi:ComF family protein
VKDIVHSLKYSGRLDHVRYIAGRLNEGMDAIDGFDFIASVPMEGSRLVERGADPCAMIAGRLSRLSSTPFARNIIARVRSVPPQVGLSREIRERNVRGVFAAHPKMRDRIEGARVLLVDDVLTTGATLNDCARALVRAGAREVCALTFARAL